MDELFLNPEERQRETELLCDGRVPGFGYAVLAALMSRDDGILSTTLTTNFDDLVADAMYVFGERKPLVIQHESLARFARPGRVRRPLVVKVHGDHRLNPMHTSAETAELKAEVASGIRGILHDRGVILVGYAGNDHGVIEALNGLPDAALPLGVWWVSRHEPRGAICGWLDSRSAVWVRSDGFDELMLLFREEFDIQHPTATKFEHMIDGYRGTYERLGAAVQDLPDSGIDSVPLKAAARRATEAASDWWGVELAARQFTQTDPDRADEIYRQGLETIEDARLLGSYAVFLTDVRKEHDRAQELYERALAADPNHANNLGSYARLLLERGNSAQAFEFIERAFKNAKEADDGLLAELWFYLLAVGPSERRGDALSALVALVNAGARSPGWDFSRIVAREREENRGAIDRLEQLAVLANRAEPDVLSDWAEWTSG